MTVVWLTVKGASQLVNRAPAVIYRWIREGRLTYEEAGDDTLMLSAAEVLELDATMKRRRRRVAVDRA